MSDDTPTRRSDPDDVPTRVGLAPGRRVFGRYTLEALVGRGGMGIVWRAHDTELDREVALKFLPETVAADEEAVRDLKRETKRCLELTHPHIVRVYDFVQDAQHAAISMEFVDGSSLVSRKVDAAGDCLALAELIPLVAQLCAALDYAHTKARIVHRDLKPANLLVNRAGDLKVTDFGIARSLSESSTRLTGKGGDTSGTMPYMSPQQVQGRKPTAADDIYALGATLYELLTSKPPFHRGDPYSLMMQIRENPPLSLAEQRAELEVKGEAIPPAWEETILACLAKEAKDRPQSAGEVALRLGLTTDGTDKGTDKKKSAERVGRVIPNAPAERRTKDSPPYRWFVAAAALVMLGVAGYFFWPKAGRVADFASGSVVPAAPTAQTGAERNPRPTTSQTPAAEPVGRVIPNAPPVPAALPREFTVTVDPADSGARLWLGPVSDLAVAGGPAVLKDLPDGEHELIVQAAGYQPFTTRVTVKDGRGSAEAKLVAVKGAFALKARAGTVVTAVDARGKETRVGSVPPGGTLSSDNLLTIGTYLFKLTHADCAEARQENVELALGRVAQLAPAQPGLPGELRVFSVPTGAEVRVNGQAAGPTPATLKNQPSEQALSVEVFQRGYRRVEQSVTLKPKEVRTVNVGTLAAEAGGIDLRFANAGLRLEQAKILLDGKAVEVGRGLRSAPDAVGRVIPNAPSASAEERRIRDNPPYLLDGLEVGARTVEIAHPDYEPWKQTVTVRDQQNTPVAVTLKPKPARLALRVAGPRDVSFFVNGRQIAAEEFKNGAVALPAQEELALEVRAQGYKSAARKITLPANGSDTWQATLEKQPYPTLGQPWENTLGMKFVPVPGTGTLFCVWDTRVQDYQAFANETRREWPKPSFEQGPTHPAVNVSWDDAQAFCQWLTQKERTTGRLGPDQKFRLPTDAEWSLAVGLGRESGSTPQEKDAKIKDVYPWGTQWPPPRGAGNYHSSLKVDDYDSTSPVGSFAANKYGLYDMGGNVWQWCEDCYDGQSGSRVLRGASFGGLGTDGLLSSYRSLITPGLRLVNFGFRCVVVVGGASSF